MSSKKVSYKTKLKLMKEYVDLIGEDISSSTIYKGYKIGIWQANIRANYRKNQLNVENEIIEGFKEIGVICDRKRRERTTDEEKYELFIEFNSKNPNVEIDRNTIDEHGNKIGELRNWFQAKYNKNDINLSSEQLRQLRKLKILNLSPNEKEEYRKKYNLTDTEINKIIQQYGNIEEFLKDYKIGNIKNIKLKNAFPNSRGIVINETDMSVGIKAGYISLVKRSLEEQPLNNIDNFILKEDIDDILELVSDRDKYIINSRFGLDGNETKTLIQLSKELNLCPQSIKNAEDRAFKKIRENIKIYSITNLLRQKEILIRKLKKISNPKYQEKYDEALKRSDIQILILKRNIRIRLNKNGYKTIGDLDKASKLSLTMVPYMTERDIQEIRYKIEDFKSKNNLKVESNQIKEELLEVEILIQLYNSAYDHYVKKEDIFDNEYIIPGMEIEEKNPRNIKDKNNNILDLTIEKKETPLEILCLDTHTYSALRRVGFDTIEKLQETTRSYLESLNCFGSVKIKEIEKKLYEYENTKFEKSLLHNKKEKRIKKEKKLDTLEEEIKEQDKKTKNIQNYFGIIEKETE